MNQFTKSVGLQFYHSAPGYLIRALRAQFLGNYQEKEKVALLDRPPYAYGLIRAGEWARNSGKKEVTVCEFGVARGGGLLSLIDLAEKLGPEMGVRFHVFGFDGGTGLPSPCGHKDHPEIWKRGQFFMDNRAELTKIVGNRARMFWGNIVETVPEFLAALTPDAPLGFISVDVDFYSTAMGALGCLSGPPEMYNPAVSVYLDDIEFFTNSEWGGELCAIRDFNDNNEHRKIGADRSIPGPERIPFLKWYPRMYVAQILDHTNRQT